MAMQDGQQRFENAVRILAKERGRIKERLLVAYVAQLSHIDSERDLPDDLVAEFDLLAIRVGEAEVVGDTGNAARNIEQMSEDEAAEVADVYFSMYLRLTTATAK